MSSPAWIRTCKPLPHLEIPAHRCGTYARGPVLLGDPALFEKPTTLPQRPRSWRNFITVNDERRVAWVARSYILDANETSLCRIVASVDRALRSVLPFDLIGRDEARRALVSEFGGQPSTETLNAVPSLRALGAARCIQTIVEEVLGILLSRCPKGVPNA